MNSYEKLRYSFDNILKELDDICKSIDDLNAIKDDIYSNDQIKINQSEHFFNSKHLEQVSFLKNNDQFASNLNRPIVSYNSYRNLLIKPEINELNAHSSSNNENDEYEILKQNFKELDNKTDKINEYYQDLYNSKIQKFNITNKENNMNKPIINSNFLLKTNSLNININDKVGSVQDAVFSFDKAKYMFPLATATYSKKNNNLNHKHKIIKQHSVDSNYNNYYDKDITNNNKFNNFDTEEKKILSLKSKLNIKAKRSNLISLNQHSVSFSSSTTNSCENLNNLILPSNNCNINEESSDKNYENDDNLNINEISKIECFYNSMGCYVYVSRCIAELYQIKREDEFDAVDIDPVSDYYNYMKNKQHSIEKKSSVNYMYINSGVPVIIYNYGANTKRNKDLRILLVERSTGFCMFEFKFDGLTKFQNSNEMTVCRLTYNNLSNFESPKNYENIKKFSGFSSAISLLTSKMANSVTYNNKINNNEQVFSYHNEYFEKYFNSKSRHAHKEHLLKFVIKKGCEEFYNELTKIMKNHQNQHLFLHKENDSFLNYLSKSSSAVESNHLFENKNDIINNEEQIKKYLSDASLSNNLELYHTALPNNMAVSALPHNLNRSSVIICHFDFSVPKAFSPNVENDKNINLAPKNEFMSSLTFDAQDTNSHKKSSIKPISKSVNLIRKYSNSSSSILSPYNEEDNDTGLEDYSKFDCTYDNSSLNSSILTTNTFNGSISNNRNPIKDILIKLKKFKKSDISNPVNFNHVAHLDKPVPIGKRYKLNY
jgi:hypothetical protein